MRCLTVHLVRFVVNVCKECMFYFESDGFLVQSKFIGFIVWRFSYMSRCDPMIDLTLRWIDFRIVSIHRIRYVAA